MKVTFPRMGNSTIVLEAIFKRLGCAVILPPPHSKRSYNLGVKYAPEFACTPLKLSLGNLIEALERGADTIVFIASDGPCRLGYYTTIYTTLLEELGYKFRMLAFDFNMGSNLEKIKELAPSKGWGEIFNAFRFGWRKLRVFEELEDLTLRIRPYETRRGDTTRAYEKAAGLITPLLRDRELKLARQKAISLLEDIPQDKSREPIKIGLVGEIFVIEEPFFNLEITRRLGELGASVDRAVWLGRYIKGMVHLDGWDPRGRVRARRAAEGYLRHEIGGEGIVSVGRSILYAQEGYDGIIHIMPFTCMPEICAQNILPRVSQDFKIPILTLIFDEHTSEEGVVNRLEAFVDLLARRRRTKTGIRKD